ncbi:hypothetical protein [Cupriavidus plantarum]|uniref:hypothetical protein n=1 Tax=Cupriavidus plantarum TaxID=942865 RepID=UPI00339D7C4A
MGVIAMAGAVFYFWRFASRRAAVVLLMFLVLGFVAYWNNLDGRRCDGKTWFCDLVPERIKEEAPPPPPPEPCPPDEPITTRIFESDAANAEFHRQVAAGVCQRTAIDRIARGWKAPFSPDYKP